MRVTTASSTCATTRSSPTPSGRCARIYTHFGDELSDDAATAMGVYAAANRQGTHGTHRYDPADYGLDRAAVDARFAEYRDRFDV